MALNALGLGFVLTAKDLASGVFQKVTGSFSAMEKQSVATQTAFTKATREMAGGLALMAGGGVLLGGAFAAASAAGHFEQVLAGTGAVMRATTEQMGQLHDAAIRAGIATQFSPLEAAEGLRTLATAGQTAKQAMETLLPVLDLSAGSLGMLGVSVAAEAVIGTLHAYSLGAEQATMVTDKLLRTTQLTNFQARDFETGLAKAAAAGGIFGTSLDDTLIALGQLRNRNIDASSSATAYRESIRRVAADEGARAAVTELGIDVYDKQTGAMRSILDITLDFADATKDITQAEKNRRIVTAFGARGLLMFNAVAGSTFTTMRDGRQVTLHGREAIEALRIEMADASGTAQKFRDTLLDTFQGQKTLFQGSMQTLANLVGEPFATALKPLVSGVLWVLNRFLDTLVAMPAPLKKFLAQIVVATSVALLLAGAFLTVVSAIKLSSMAMTMFGGTVMGTLGPLLPVLGAVVAWVAGIAFAVALLARAWSGNKGGILDGFSRMGHNIGLVFDALGQLKERGGFFGPIRDELNKAENKDIKTFVLSIYQMGYRIKQFLEGMTAGFDEAVSFFEPIFGTLGEAFRMLADSFTEGSRLLSTGSGAFNENGKVMGRILGTVASAISFFLVPLVVLASYFVALPAWGKAVALTIAVIGLAAFTSTSEFTLWALAILAVVEAFKQLSKWGDQFGGWVFEKTGGVTTPRQAGRGMNQPLVGEDFVMPPAALPPASPGTVAATAATTAASGETLTRIIASLQPNDASANADRAAKAHAKELAKLLGKQTTVVQLDGVEVGRAVRGAQRGEQDRSGEVPEGAW